MVEAQSLRGEFGGWTTEARDAKILSLARLIASFRFFSFECSVSTADHKALFAGRVPFGLARAYSTALYGVTSALARYVYECGGREPIHFVFDTQEGADKDTEALWPWLKLTSPGPWRVLLGPAPRFADDLEEVALQAADMLAWHRRRAHDDREASGSRAATEMLMSDPHLVLPIPNKALASLAGKMARVPGVKGMVSKGDWRETRDVVTAHQGAGLGPPKYGPRMTFAALTLKRPLAVMRYLHSRWQKAQRQRAAKRRRPSGGAAEKC